MEFYERLSARPVLWAKLHELTGVAFQNFFHDLMTACDPTFVDVRTHGNRGDLSSDGLSLHDRTLYACYAPETPDATKTVSKFWSDLEGALEKRKGQFDKFTFVHNDTRGTHPDISVALSNARRTHPGIEFEVIGYRHLRDRLGGLSRAQAEDLLGSELPLQHTVADGLRELEQLLAEVAANGIPLEDAPPVDQVSVNKLAFSELTDETRGEVRDAMRHSRQIDEYYARLIDVNERDDVANRFNSEYLSAVEEGLDPEAILLQLRIFLAGAVKQTAPAYRAQTAVLAYFFQRCDIFENPPPGWTPSALAVS